MINYTASEIHQGDRSIKIGQKGMNIMNLSIKQE